MRKALLIFVLCLPYIAFGQERVEILFPCTETLEQPYGITAEISRKGGEFLTKETAFENLTKEGANYIRVPMFWDVCYYDGNFTFKIYDETMEAAKVTPFSILGVLSPSFDRNLSVWNCPNEYIRYVKEVGSRYKFYISDWEVIPGLDYQEYQGKKPQPSQIFSAIRGTYSILKAVNPNNRVILGCLDNPRAVMLDSLCANGGTKYFDVLSFTCYGDPEHIIAQARSAKVLMKKYKWEKPVWITNAYYSSLPVENTDNDFWETLVPKGLAKLKITPSKTTVGIVVSEQQNLSALNYYQIERFFTSKFKEVRLIKITDIATLEPSDVQVLVPGCNVAMNDIAAYLAKSGTVILSQPLWPSVTHIDVTHTAGDPARYLTIGRLRPDETMIPLQESGNGVVSALYRLKTGNVIVDSRNGRKQFIDKEQEQAKRVARIYLTAYACGIDKVYWNGLKSKEKDNSIRSQFAGLYHSDFSPKPAAQAYSTLTKMLPSGSSRPELIINDGIYLASWIIPDGTKRFAVWSPSRHIPFNLKIYGRATYCDYLGNKQKSISEINDAICFISGAEKIDFK